MTRTKTNSCYVFGGCCFTIGLMDIYTETWAGKSNLEVTLVFVLGKYFDQWLVPLCLVESHITTLTLRL